ncbi:MAG: iron-sulfur cluster assembly accessory protein [bacterium]|nr:iron-sulfur cluster assembly accessory protein [bacterium]
MIRFTPEAVAQWRSEHPASAPGATPVVRLSVVAGGCAGLRYVLESVPAPAADDIRMPHDGLLVTCAPADLPRLRGLCVDYVDAMVGGGYRFANPNAGRTCGCGESFAEPAD